MSIPAVTHSYALLLLHFSLIVLKCQYDSTVEFTSKPAPRYTIYPFVGMYLERIYNSCSVVFVMFNLQILYVSPKLGAKQ